MTSRKLRRLVVEGRTYLWHVEHHHNVLVAPPPGGRRVGRCREVLTVYLQGHKVAPLRIAFDDGEGRHAGYPATGVVWTSEEPKTEANLNAPGVVRLLLERALAAGWEPEHMRQPTVIDDGFALLR